jgi:hypothetical protein
MLRPISEDEFTAGDPADRIVEDEHPRRFAALQLAGASRPLLLGWRSDAIDPTLAVEPTTGDTWIGVDEHLVCVSGAGAVRFAMGLASPVLDIQVSEAWVVVLCEIQVLAVNRDHSVRTIRDLPEVAESVRVEDDELIVGLMDGGEHTLPF